MNLQTNVDAFSHGNPMGMGDNKVQFGNGNGNGNRNIKMGGKGNEPL